MVTSQGENGFTEGRYIVVLAEKPAASYDGGLPGLPATRPAKGQKMDARSADVQRYRHHLQSAQNQVAHREGIAIKKSFSTAINAFTAHLSVEQASRLAKDPQVLSVAADGQAAPAYSTLDYLKVDGPDGLWQKQFQGAAAAGKGVVVGVIDSGYTPSNPFFRGEEVKSLGGKTPVVGEPYRTDEGEIQMLKSDGGTFSGDCQAGQGFAGTECNSKVISARYFPDEYLNDVPPEHRAPEELLSPVDVGGHGSHTASTAAGNAAVRTTLGGRDMGVTGGVAPGAKLAIYKTCWQDDDPDTGGCYYSSAVAAIDQAILDGVDVLNYSISGFTDTTSDPVSLAFLSAVSAGIFVSAAGSNNGPGAGTIAHGAPWLTTVAASTFTGQLQGTVEFADGTKFRGASIMAHSVPDTKILLGADAPSGSGNATYCAPGSLAPDVVKGTIVVCDRGGDVDRVVKSAEVKRAGGAGMVLVNLSEGTEDTDQHAVPSVHINIPDSLALKQKVEKNPGIEARLVDHDTTGLPVAPQPQIAGFSSRGPLLTAGSDLLKPDLAAPGVNVLAAISPIASGGAQFGMMSGTSMAAPHVAGFAALALSKHPDWSPATIKSALMTTATDIRNADGSRNGDLFATGSGEVNPAGYLAPGLVYDAGQDDYLGYLQGQGLNLGIEGLKSIAARDMNVPSFAVGSFAGSVEVTRTVTALTPGIFRARADVPGIRVTISPSVLNFDAAGQKKSFKVRFESTGTNLGKFTMGHIVWEGAGHKVTSPVAVRAESLQVASELNFSSADGDGRASVPFTGGVSGAVKARMEGLAKADARPVELVPGPVAEQQDASNAVTTVTVAPGAPLAKFAVVSSSSSADFDLTVRGPDGKERVASTSSASESIVWPDPAPGEYTVMTNLYASPDGAKTKASLEATVLGVDEHVATIEPSPLAVRTGQKSSFDVKWSGLAPGSYLGRVSYDGSSHPTLVDLRITDPAQG
ncbi:S8 family peptidase [Arthrobacter woluwensis]|nr:S8 family peptidase [Arthrobacter woluwensis]